MLAVVALGGNAVARGGGRVGSPKEQWEMARLAAADIADLVVMGFDPVVTHGNGPQVGLLAERLSDYLSLDMMVAATEGWMGYLLMSALALEFRRRGIRRKPIALVSRVAIRSDDPAFRSPSKYIGPIYGEGEIRELEARGWVLKPVDGGYRRVVPSPEPVSTLDTDAVPTLIDGGFVPIVLGGGGVPVVNDEGAEAVVDKDLASQVLANSIGAGYLVILTNVDGAYLNYGRPSQVRISRMTLEDAERYYREGHFPPGNMGPKILASIRFLRGGGRAAYIGSLGSIKDLMMGNTGTIIEP